MAEYLLCDMYWNQNDAINRRNKIRSIYILDCSGREYYHDDLTICDNEYFIIKHKVSHDDQAYDYVDDRGEFCYFGDNDCGGFRCECADEDDDDYEHDYEDDCCCESTRISNGEYIEIRNCRLSPVVNKPISEFDPIKSAFPQLDTNNDKERGNIMKNENMFSNIMPAFNFGPVNDGRIKMSISGLAVRSADGAYLAYQNGSVTDVTPMLIDMPGMIFAMPVSTKTISQGDYIDHQGKIYIVMEVLDDSLDCIDVATSTKVGVVPVKNVFGFNFYTKYMTPMGGMFADGEVSEDNPFGGFGKIMMMQAMLGGGMFGANGGDNSNFFQMMMLSKMMGSGNFDFGNMF